MSQQNDTKYRNGFVAGADLSADAAATTSKRYRAVKYDGTTARSVISVTGASDAVAGVQQNLPESGEAMELACGGTSKVRAGGIFNANALLKIDAGGKFVSGGAGADVNWARSLEAAAADGDIVEAILFEHPLTT